VPITFDAQARQASQPPAPGPAASEINNGLATLAAGSVVVRCTYVTASSRFQLTPQDTNTTGILRITARVPGVSFTISSSVGTDSGVVAWEIKG
jgi:hypothetical protein